MSLVTKAADRMLALVVPRATAGACCTGCGYSNCYCRGGYLYQKLCCVNCNCRGTHCYACFMTTAHCV
jgi:hypothetical protein